MTSIAAPESSRPAANPAGRSAADARHDLLAAWLATHADRYALDLATLAPASADASFRRYYRVNSAGEHGASLIAVDAPPPEKSREFAQVAGLLAAADVHVPRVLEADFDAGLMLVTDLGTAPYLKALQDAGPGPRSRELMRDVLDALIRWQLASREGVLPPFDEAFLRREMELMPEWYLQRHLGREIDDATRGVLDRTFALLVASARAQPQVFMLRDFMPRNLMIATPNPGVLDFQDAVYGPITYDVVSLLRDAFISWDEEFELDCFAHYWERAKKAGLPVDADFGEFYRQLEWMGLQRHIKVLGLFCRINYRDGKPQYMADLPRFLSYASKVAHRYRPLVPFARLIDELQGTSVETGYTF